MHVLLVEDDRKLTEICRRVLGEEGIAVEVAEDGPGGLARLRVGGFDACVLDLLLPGMDGFAVLAEARGSGVKTPVLILTARDGVPDRVRGLDLGADDYLVKPFAFAELLARLRAMTRRGAPARDAPLRCGDLDLDPAAHRVRRNGRDIEMSARQFALLEYLLRRRGEVVTRAMLLGDVFGYRFDPGTNVVDVHVANLRRKIDDPDRPSQIETVRGVGYRLGGEGGGS